MLWIFWAVQPLVILPDEHFRRETWATEMQITFPRLHSPLEPTWFLQPELSLQRWIHRGQSCQCLLSLPLIVSTESLRADARSWTSWGKIKCSTSTCNLRSTNNWKKQARWRQWLNENNLFLLFHTQTHSRLPRLKLAMIPSFGKEACTSIQQTLSEESKDGGLCPRLCPPLPLSWSEGCWCVSGPSPTGPFSFAASHQWRPNLVFPQRWVQASQTQGSENTVYHRIIDQEQNL